MEVEYKCVNEIKIYKFNESIIGEHMPLFNVLGV